MYGCLQCAYRCLLGIHAQPCCCLDLDTPNHSSLVSGQERLNPQGPVALQIQLPLMEDPGNMITLTSLVPHILTCVLMEQQLVFFPNASITKQTQSAEKPLTICTSTSNDLLGARKGGFRTQQPNDNLPYFSYFYCCFAAMSNAVSKKWKWKLLCSCQNNNGYSVGNCPPALHNSINKRNWEKPTVL